MVSDPNDAELIAPEPLVLHLAADEADALLEVKGISTDIADRIRAAIATRADEDARAATAVQRALASRYRQPTTRGAA